MWFVVLLAFLVWVLASGRFQVYADLATKKGA